jgi:hypothetical protein
MSKVERILNEAQFLAKIGGALLELGKKLFKRTGGDYFAARKELERIPDYWDDWDERQAAVDRRVEELKQQGK